MVVKLVCFQMSLSLSGAQYGRETLLRTFHHAQLEFNRIPVNNILTQYANLLLHSRWYLCMRTEPPIFAPIQSVSSFSKLPFKQFHRLPDLR